jgi:hypothetical protein
MDELDGALQRRDLGSPSPDELPYSDEPARRA